MEELQKIKQSDMNEPYKDPKVKFRIICAKYTEHIRKLKLPDIPKPEESRYNAVLIEFRIMDHLEFLIRNCIYKLGSNWSHTIVCGNMNYKYMSAICGDIHKNIKVIRLDIDNLNQSTYSALLSSENFWKMLDGEKQLIYQEDSMVFGKNINDFIGWDYIGAPWPKHHSFTKNMVGNGGFSLRTKACMLECIRKINIHLVNYHSNIRVHVARFSTPPEDVYYSTVMEEFGIGNIADWESARLFSTETVTSPNSFGGHNMWFATHEWAVRVHDNIINTILHG